MHLESKYFREFSRKKNQNDPNGFTQGLGETDSWKTLKSKISWHCPLKCIILIRILEKKCRQNKRHWYSIHLRINSKSQEKTEKLEKNQRRYRRFWHCCQFPVLLYVNTILPLSLVQWFAKLKKARGRNITCLLWRNPRIRDSQWSAPCLTDFSRQFLGEIWTKHQSSKRTEKILQRSQCPDL